MRIIIAYVLMLVSTSSNLLAQRRESPADTGRISWGHSDFKGYNRAFMCNRALDEVDRQHHRIYKKDTMLAPIRGNKEFSRKVHKAAADAAKLCISHLKLDEQTPDQLWAISRIYMVLGERQKSIEAAERAIETGINRGERTELSFQALQMYLNYGSDYLPQVYYFADKIRSEEPVSHVARFKVDVTIANIYFIVYSPDSVIRYANSAIESLEKMTLEEMDSVVATGPFELLMLIADLHHNIPLYDSIIERATPIVSNWSNGRGHDFISGASRVIDTKKTLYSRKVNKFESKIWENYDGVPRPLIGKPSIFVVINHNCEARCANLFNLIKRLSTTFRDSIDITLITETMGYAPGTGPVTPVEEGRIAAKYLKDIYDITFPLLIDEAPTFKMPDGRVIRDRGTVATMFEELGNVNALLTDEEGRIQWAGPLRSEGHIRSVVAVIDRILNKMKKY